MKKTHSRHQQYAKSIVAQKIIHVPIVLIYLMWSCGLFAFIVYRLIHDPGEFIMYLTNWNIVLQCVFSVLYLLTLAFPKRYLCEVTYGFLFWVVYGLGWLVFFLFIYVIAQAPTQLTMYIDKYGGDYNFSLVYIVNTVVHVFVCILPVILLMYEYRTIQSMLPTFKTWKKHPWRVTFLLTFLTLSPLSIMLAYRCVVSPNEVYHLKAPEILTVALSFVIVILTNGVTIFTMFLNRNR